jgi:hypothetical protein
MSIFEQTVELAGGDCLFMAGPSGQARLLPEFLFSLYDQSWGRSYREECRIYNSGIGSQSADPIAFCFRGQVSP